MHHILVLLLSGRITLSLQREHPAYANDIINKYSRCTQIFTDGSVRGPKSSRAAGSGYVIQLRSKRIQDSYSPNTDSIAIAELTAIDRALTKMLEVNDSSDVAIFCDNKYVVSCTTKLIQSTCG